MSEKISPSERQSIHGQWSSRLAFILAVSGSAVGLGNIWKFPYITGVNGGGAFVLIYLLCILAIGFPIMISEIMLGRRGRRNPITSMELLGREETGSGVWKFVGVIGLVAGFLILSFYSVIAGWTLNYFILSLKGTFTGLLAPDVNQVFDNLNQSFSTQLIFHTIFMAVTILIIAKGIRQGLERVVIVLMPALFFILIILLFYVISQGNISEGFTFMFRPDFTKIDGNSVLAAMGHAFFTLSLGMGCVVAYGAYLPKQESIFKTTFAIILCDTLIALVAGLIVFSIVFDNNLDPSQIAGAGLIFKTLPLAFGQMPNGVFFGSIFFVLLGFAALTSAISLLEPSVAWMIERKNLTRGLAAIIMGTIIWALGLFTVLSGNALSDFIFWKGTLFDNFDHLASNILLPTSGFLFTVFAGWFMSKKSSADELDTNRHNPLAASDHNFQYKFWRFLARYVAPIAVLIIFLNAIGMY